MLSEHGQGGPRAGAVDLTGEGEPPEAQKERRDDDDDNPERRDENGDQAPQSHNENTEDLERDLLEARSRPQVREVRFREEPVSDEIPLTAVSAEIPPVEILSSTQATPTRSIADLDDLETSDWKRFRSEVSHVSPAVSSSSMVARAVSSSSMVARASETER